MSPSAEKNLTPISITELGVPQWCEQQKWVLTLAYLLARIMPRGKGWFPRQLGRLIGRSMQTSIQTSSGTILAVDPANLDIYTTIMRFSGTWEKYVFNACMSVLRPGHVFYDIGANAGYMALEIANHFRSDVTVVAFEPQSSLNRMIVQSAQLNQLDNVLVYPVLLGKSSGIETLYIPSHAIHASIVSREKGAKTIEYPMTTLDLQVIRHRTIPPPDVIKIDVEGSELDIFHGAEKTILTYAPAIVFEADENMERFGYGFKDIVEFLSSLIDYEFYRIGEDDTLKPVVGNEGHANFLAVPPGLHPITGKGANTFLR